MIRYAFSLVWRRKLRTILTSLGITISVILLSLIIFGMQDLQRLITVAFQDQFNPNEIFISNSAAVNFIIPSDDDESSVEEVEEQEVTLIDDRVVQEISEISGVERAQPIKNITSLEGQIEGRNKILTPTIGSAFDTTGEDTLFSDFWGEVDGLATGGVFVSTTFAELYAVEPEELLGETLILTPSRSGFGAGPSRAILDKEYRYEIVGVVDPGRDRNDVIFSLEEGVSLLVDLGDFESAEEYISEFGYDILRVQATEDSVTQVRSDIESRYNFGAVFTADDILSFFDQIIGAFTLVLILFGVVSAVVASIGIMNTMVMSIYEQTKEIGIIKSMGASQVQILIIFLIQSGVIGLFGGATGLGVVLLGMYFGDPFIVEVLQENGFAVNIFFTFDPQIISIIIGISVLVGVIAGLYPALKAASLNPVDALRSD